MKWIRAAALAALALMGIAVTGTASAAPGSVVLPPQQQSYGQLGMLWWKWALAIPAAQNPILDQSGQNCAVDQRGGMWFLAGTPGGTAPRVCTIPAGKTIFFPIITLENDYPCLFDPSFQPAPGQSLPDFLTEGAVSVINQVTDLHASLDGKDIPNVQSYRGTSNMYSFAGDISLKSVLDPCITGSQQRAVSDGYWLLLAPLSPGHHTLEFGGTAPGAPGMPPQSESAAYSLTVQ
jgi:hypothetical protein